MAWTDEVVPTGVIDDNMRAGAESRLRGAEAEEHVHRILQHAKGVPAWLRPESVNFPHRWERLCRRWASKHA